PSSRPLRSLRSCRSFSSMRSASGRRVGRGGSRRRTRTPIRDTRAVSRERHPKPLPPHELLRKPLPFHIERTRELTYALGQPLKIHLGEPTSLLTRKPPLACGRDELLVPSLRGHTWGRAEPRAFLA